MLLLRLLSFAKIAQKEFSGIVKSIEIFDDRIKLIFIDESYMEVRYPQEDKYSFHWQRGSEVYRIDTAPHHRQVTTFPRHIHSGSEDNVIEDNVTSLSNTPEENFRRVLNWVKSMIQKNI